MRARKRLVRQMLRIFIGYDRREIVAFHTLVESILATASVPVAIVPLSLALLRARFDRPRHPLQSTDFAFTRFLTPAFSDFEGWSLFLDCDMVVLADLAELWALRDERHAVMVVQHRYEPTDASKFLRQPQTPYEKKNWSSVMLFNNARCRRLSPDYVASASGLDLHQFKWLDGDHEIGALPARWNHLVGYDPPSPDIALLHYTAGGPWFADSSECEYAEAWRRVLARTLSAGDAAPSAADSPDR